jgi:hypothetical protein
MMFLSQYDETVFNNAIQLREVLLANLPGIIEQVDLPAKMIAYCYGQKYMEMICMLIPSKKGLKLSFYQGPTLPDPENLLEGKGKLTRYAEIRSEQQVYSKAIAALIKNAFKAYKDRMGK